MFSAVKISGNLTWPEPDQWMFSARGFNTLHDESQSQFFWFRGNDSEILRFWFFFVNFSEWTWWQSFGSWTKQSSCPWKFESILGLGFSRSIISFRQLWVGQSSIYMRTKLPHWPGFDMCLPKFKIGHKRIIGLGG